MSVIPVLLLLMQLMGAVIGGANETAAALNGTVIETGTGNASVSNVNATIVLSAVKNNNNNNNATGPATNTGTGIPTKTVNTEGNTGNSSTVSSKELPKNDKDRSDSKVNTTTTVQAATSAKPTTTTIQTPLALNATAISTTAITNAQSTKTTATNLNKPLTEGGLSQSDTNSPSSKNNNNNSSSKQSPAGIGNGSANSSNSSSTTPAPAAPSTTSTTSTTTTSTTTTTTMRPLKPNITRSMAVPVPGEKDQQLNAATIDSARVDASIIKSDPISQSVQEMVSSIPNHDENEYLVPIVTVMFTVPLAIFVFIILYRRFRDLWTTRHYRRMDFLVDGMYND
ncbi:cell wall protein DAN4 [Drosophila innubila]|uniref:cell wall protein DAN4 n=1 Tax=Drosophila innubila TaxID=198719 RepID=UPI00148E0E5A|nr:cell wall protein DAN4 [Drosophila innubila]